MSEFLVGLGPAIIKEPRAPLATPVCLRMVGGVVTYDWSTDEEIEPEPLCHLNVLLIGTDGEYLQRNISFNCDRKPALTGTRIAAKPAPGDMPWLPEPNVNGLRSVSMQVDKNDLVSRLRALADELEKL